MLTVSSYNNTNFILQSKCVQNWNSISICFNSPLSNVSIWQPGSGFLDILSRKILFSKSPGERHFIFKNNNLTSLPLTRAFTTLLIQVWGSEHHFTALCSKQWQLQYSATFHVPTIPELSVAYGLSITSKNFEALPITFLVNQDVTYSQSGEFK